MTRSYQGGLAQEKRIAHSTEDLVKALVPWIHICPIPKSPFWGFRVGAVIWKTSLLCTRQMNIPVYSERLRDIKTPQEWDNQTRVRSLGVTDNLKKITGPTVADRIGVDTE